MRILMMADIHIGSIRDVNYIYNTITDIMDKELVYDKTDLVVLLGDYFHRLFKVNEEYVSLAINIMSYLIRLCQNSNTKIRIIYGTESHEMNQYKLFNYHLNDSSIDIRIIDTVTSENMNGYDILYIPEEYIISKSNHYKKYFNQKYQYIFGHGTISEGMPMVIYHSSEKSNEKKLPTFKSDELSSISNICVFGHYHCFTDMNDNCYYLGSLFRDSFNEEDPKGYGIIEDDMFKFIENEQAYIYRTYTFDEESIVYMGSEHLIRAIKEVKDENEEIFSGSRLGKIRMIFKLPNNVDPSFKETVRSLLFNDKFIAPLIKEQSELVAELEEEIGDSEYDFILDNSLAITDKIHRYLSKEYDCTMSLEELSKYISEEFKV